MDISDSSSWDVTYVSIRYVVCTTCVIAGRELLVKAAASKTVGLALVVKGPRSVAVLEKPLVAAHTCM
jgi:hypothetical protein